jgi:hypothetical protein
LRSDGNNYFKESWLEWMKYVTYGNFIPLQSNFVINRRFIHKFTCTKIYFHTRIWTVMWHLLVYVSKCTSHCMFISLLTISELHSAFTGSEGNCNSASCSLLKVAFSGRKWETQEESSDSVSPDQRQFKNLFYYLLEPKKAGRKENFFCCTWNSNGPSIFSRYTNCGPEGMVHYAYALICP